MTVTPEYLSFLPSSCGRADSHETAHRLFTKNTDVSCRTAHVFSVCASIRSATLRYLVVYSALRMLDTARLPFSFLLASPRRKPGGSFGDAALRDRKRGRIINVLYISGIIPVRKLILLSFSLAGIAALARKAEVAGAGGTRVRNTRAPVRTIAPTR